VDLSDKRVLPASVPLALPRLSLAVLARQALAPRAQARAGRARTRMRCASSGQSGLWSRVSGMAAPPCVASTARVSPTCAT
jgi:hypothetical protein